MSNSINEIRSAADDSLLLAMALSISPVASFTIRFGRANTLLIEQRESQARMQTALSLLEGLVSQSRRIWPWWNSSQTQSRALSLVAALVAAGIWYEIDTALWLLRVLSKSTSEYGLAQPVSHPSKGAMPFFDIRNPHYQVQCGGHSVRKGLKHALSKRQTFHHHRSSLSSEYGLTMALANFYGYS